MDLVSPRRALPGLSAVGPRDLHLGMRLPRWQRRFLRTAGWRGRPPVPSRGGEPGAETRVRHRATPIDCADLIPGLCVGGIPWAFLAC